MRIDYVKPTGLWFFSRSIWEIATTLRRDTHSVFLSVLLHGLVLPILLLVLLPAHLLLDLATLPFEMLAGFRLRR